MKMIELQTNSRFDIVDITSDVKEYVRKKNIDSGLLTIFIPHTTAGVSINENADPDVLHDMKNGLNKLVPENDNYRHGEGNSQAHMLSTLVSSSITLIIYNGNIVLGTWQGIYFTEFDGARKRKIYLKAVSG